MNMGRRAFVEAAAMSAAGCVVGGLRTEIAREKNQLTPLHCGVKFSIIPTHMNMEEPAVER